MTQAVSDPPPTVRITLVKDSYTGWNGQIVPGRTEVREFTDDHEASDFLVNDSYFSEPYTITALWERIDAAHSGSTVKVANILAELTESAAYIQRHVDKRVGLEETVACD